MATNFMAHPDFTEGVSARLINKPPTEPKWSPSTLAEVSHKDISNFFTLSEGAEALRLIDPIDGKQPNNYMDYPHAGFALPRESDIEAVVVEKGQDGKKAVMNEVLKRWKNKLGVREKVTDVLARKTEAAGERAIKWVEEKETKANL